MRNKPIDTSRLGTLRCEIAPEPRLTPDGDVRRDRDGRPQWVTAVAVRQMEGRRVETIDVVVSGEPPHGIAEGTEVAVVNLWANDWEVDGRSGTSYRADAITAASGAAPAGPAASETPRAKGSAKEAH